MWVCVQQWSTFGEEVERREAESKGESRGERDREREQEKKTETVQDEVKRNGQVKRRETRLDNLFRSNVMNTVNELKHRSKQCK